MCVMLVWPITPWLLFHSLTDSRKVSSLVGHETSVLCCCTCTHMTTVFFWDNIQTLTKKTSPRCRLNFLESTQVQHIQVTLIFTIRTLNTHLRVLQVYDIHGMHAPPFPSHSGGVLGAGGLLNLRPSTRGGETNVDADGCPAQAPPWETREVDSNALKLKRLLPATNYMVRRERENNQ